MALILASLGVKQANSGPSVESLLNLNRIYRRTVNVSVELLISNPINELHAIREAEDEL